MSDSNIIFNIDFESVLKTHIEKNADITCLYRTSAVNTGETSITVTQDCKVVEALYHFDAHDNEKDVIINGASLIIN